MCSCWPTNSRGCGQRFGCVVSAIGPICTAIARLGASPAHCSCAARRGPNASPMPCGVAASRADFIRYTTSAAKRRTDCFLPACWASRWAYWPGIFGYARKVDRVSKESAIHVEGLNFSYPDGRVALTDLRFDVAANETIGLIGPNGAGKTTLFLCLAGVLPCRPGVMSICGLDPANSADRRALPARVGLVFQNSDDQLFNATVFDDVAFGPLNLELPPDEVPARVAEALAKVGLVGVEKRVPWHLSGGEKRRVAFAGVLAMRPAVLLLDQPSMY